MESCSKNVLIFSFMTLSMFKITEKHVRLCGCVHEIWMADRGCRVKNAQVPMFLVGAVPITFTFEIGP